VYYNDAFCLRGVFKFYFNNEIKDSELSCIHPEEPNKYTKLTNAINLLWIKYLIITEDNNNLFKLFN